MHRTLFQIGPIVLNAYTTMLTLAFLLGTLLAVRRAKNWGIPAHEVVKLATLVIVASIAGSRLLYVLERVRVFVERPGDILLIWKGGLSYHGGLFSGLFAALLWLKVKGIPIGKMVDIFAPSMALGFVVVRIGCFLNGCCFGTPTEVPWGLAFPPASPAGWVYGNINIHPVQLYASISGLIGFLLLLWIEKKYPFGEGNGLLFLSCLALSSFWRFLMEFFRYQEPHACITGGFTIVQAYCFGLFILSCTIIWRTYTKCGLADRPRNNPIVA